MASAPIVNKADILARANSGTASFYGGNLDGGNCLFTGYSLPSDTFGTALSNARWDSGAQCGACVSVTGPNGKTIKAMVCLLLWLRISPIKLTEVSH